VMTPVETVVSMPYLLPKMAVDTALGNLSAIESLRSATKAKRTLSPVSSSLAIPRASFELGEILQGDTKTFTIALENHGTAPLELWVRPECGCMTLQAPTEIAPNSKGSIPVSFDPTEFRGKIEKKIFIVSNDPQNPLTAVSMNVFVRPTYQFIMPNGPVIVAGDKGGKAEVFLTFNNSDPFGIRKIVFSGVPGAVDFDPWEGSLPDLAIGEPAKARQGYKLTISVGGNLPPGRSPSSVMILTDNEKFPMIQCQVYAQRGIVAVPDELFLGDPASGKTIKFLISRPGKPFKILSVSSDCPNIHVSTKPSSNGQEYVLEAVYDGKADATAFPASLSVKTDDPKQPLIKVPVTAINT
jgi:hypothetical protein